VIDVFDGEPIGMSEARLATDRRRLDRLQSLAARSLQDGEERFEPIDLDCQPRRLERRALLGRSSDDQHREVRRRDGGEIESCFRIGEKRRVCSPESSAL
jgi:hypothetical protein